MECGGQVRAVVGMLSSWCWTGWELPLLAVPFLKLYRKEAGRACVTVGSILYGKPILLPRDSIVYRKMHNCSVQSRCVYPLLMLCLWVCSRALSVCNQRCRLVASVHQQQYGRIIFPAGSHYSIASVLQTCSTMWGQTEPSDSAPRL